MMELNLFDLGVLVIIGLSALLSFFRGFVREVLSLAGWVAASVVTLRFLEPATKYLKPQVGSDMLASGIAAVGLFFITLITVSILSGSIIKFLKPGDKVGLIDNLAGLAFGVARGVLIIAIGYFIMTVVVVEKDHPKWVKQAYARPYAAKCAKWIKTLTPDYVNKITKRSSKPVDLPDAIDEETEDLPSIEDLQERIREENEEASHDRHRD